MRVRMLNGSVSVVDLPLAVRVRARREYRQWRESGLAVGAARLRTMFPQ